jgi:hypothetical protein
MSHFGRGSARWWEVMRGECSGHFGSGRGVGSQLGAVQAGGGARLGSC